MATKTYFHATFTIILILTACLGLFSFALAETQALGQDVVIEKLKERSIETNSRIEKLTYTADSLTTVTGSNGKLERTVTSRRVITFVPPDQIEADFLGMTINGRALSAKEIAEELKKSKGRQGQSPFLPEELPKYQFAVKEKKEYQDLPVWEVAFEPLEAGEGLAVGYAYIHQKTYDVVFMTFTPSQIPSVMKKMQAEIQYQPVADKWLPSSFQMNMHLKVEFIFTLADKIIDVQETYSGHQLQEIAQ